MIYFSTKNVQVFATLCVWVFDFFLRTSSVCLTHLGFGTSGVCVRVYLTDSSMKLSTLMTTVIRKKEMQVLNFIFYIFKDDFFIIIFHIIFSKFYLFHFLLQYLHFYFQTHTHTRLSSIPEMIILSRNASECV